MTALLRSARLRLALLSSALFFLVTAAVGGATYLAVSRSLDDDVATRTVLLARRMGDLTVVERAEVVDVVARAEQEMRRETLDDLRRAGVIGGLALFPVSVLIGWLVAGRVLAPVDRITGVAREIEASDLGRRIALDGPDDELKRLADTFDTMLARLDESAARQRQLIQNASHELRNPLAVAATNLDVALRDPSGDPEAVRERVAVARRTIDRLSGVVDDLIAGARQQPGPEARVDVDLATLAGEVAAEYRGPAAERRLDVRAAGDGGVVVRAHRDGLHRAVGNLVDNAVRLAPEGTTVTVACGTREGWAWIGVRDRGPGIPAEQQDLVFRRFWRASDGGTGLGLAIVRQVAESHAGTVTLTSRPGWGSSFVVWLPRTPSAGPVPARPDPLGPDLNA